MTIFMITDKSSGTQVVVVVTLFQINLTCYTQGFIQYILYTYINKIFDLTLDIHMCLFPSVY